MVLLSRTRSKDGRNGAMTDTGLDVNGNEHGGNGEGVQRGSTSSMGRGSSYKNSENDSTTGQQLSYSRWKIPYYKMHRKPKAVPVQSVPEMGSSTPGSIKTVKSNGSAGTNNALDDLNHSLSEQLAKEALYRKTQTPEPFHSVERQYSVSPHSTDATISSMQSGNSNNRLHSYQHNYVSENSIRTVSGDSLDSNDNNQGDVDNQQSQNNSHHHRASRMLKLFKPKHSEHDQDVYTGKEIVGSLKQLPSKRSYSSRILQYATGHSSKNKMSSPVSRTASSSVSPTMTSATLATTVSHAEAKNMFTITSQSDLPGYSTDQTSVTENRANLTIRTKSLSSTVSPLHFGYTGLSPMHDNRNVQENEGTAIKRSKSYSMSEMAQSPYSPYAARSVAGHMETMSLTSSLSASYSNIVEAETAYSSPVVSKFAFSTSTGTGTTNNAKKYGPGAKTPQGYSEYQRLKRANTFSEVSVLNDYAQKQQQNQLTRTLTSETPRLAHNTGCSTDGQGESFLNVSPYSARRSPGTTDEYGDAMASEPAGVKYEDMNDASIAFNKVFYSASNSMSNLNVNLGGNALNANYMDTTVAIGANNAQLAKSNRLSRRTRTNTLGSSSSRTSVSTTASSVARYSPVRATSSPSANRRHSLTIGTHSAGTGSNAQNLFKNMSVTQQNAQGSGNWSSFSSGSSSIMSNNLRNSSTPTFNHLSASATTSATITPTTTNFLGTESYLDMNLGKPLPPHPQVLGGPKSNTSILHQQNKAQLHLSLPSKHRKNQKSVSDVYKGRSNSNPLYTKPTGTVLSEAPPLSAESNCGFEFLSERGEDEDFAYREVYDSRESKVVPPNSASTITSATVQEEHPLHYSEFIEDFDKSLRSTHMDTVDDCEFLSMMLDFDGHNVLGGKPEPLHSNTGAHPQEQVHGDMFDLPELGEMDDQHFLINVINEFENNAKDS